MLEDYAFLVVFVLGESVSLYFYRSNRRTAGILFALSSLLLGSTASTNLLYGVSQTYVVSILAVWLLSVPITLYLAYRTPRALFFFFFPIYFVAQSLSPSFSALEFLALLALLVGLLLAYSLSEFDLGLIEYGNTWLRILAAPFRELEQLVVYKLPGKRSRPTLFFFYSMFCVLVIAISILIGEGLQRLVEPELLLVIPLAYLAYLTIEWRKAADGLPPPESSA